jgi:SNF family Na+-dependent transporter
MKITQWKRIAYWILFVFLAVSSVFTVVRLILAPAETTDEFTKIKSDYVLMLLQCLVGLVVMSLPGLIERKRQIDIPDSLEILYAVFLFCSIYLGEVRDFFYLVPHWDTLLHAFSGIMLGLVGFTLVDLLNESKRVSIHLSPIFVALFSFCFALAVGCVWEIYEFLADGVLATNMQKFRLADGTELVGRAALSDTMEDFIVDALSALAATIVGYLAILRRRKHAANDNLE